MLSMAINALGGYLRPGTERDYLPWVHDDDSALPNTPRVVLDDVDDPYPESINPSSDPEALLNDAQARQRVSSPHFTPDEEEKNS